ncbi:MAG: Crp/Fnr family transcriptional regulator [Sphingomicrobium sp.]
MLQYTSIRPVECEESLIESPIANPLVTKLDRFVSLGSEEVASISALCRDQRTLPADHVIIEEGSRPDHVCVIFAGFAFRYKFLPGGRRQIVGYVVPGDLCDVHFAVFDPLDHSVASLGDSTVVEIPVRKLLDLVVRYPAIERGLSLAALVDRSILLEWLLNIAQRNAYQKLSHFFCEMSVRLKAIGHVNSDGSLELPLNQAALADTTGLTLVHINRTLQRMRCEGLIALRRRRLTILDPDRLAAIAGFEDNYLAPQVASN